MDKQNDETKARDASAVNTLVSTTEPQNEVTLFGVNYDGALDEHDYCPRCDGSGWIPTTPLDGMEHYEFGSNGTKTCPLCAGTGK